MGGSGKDMSSMSMMDLFRQEAENHCSILSGHLLTLEKDSGDQEVLAELMRAAHSIKGAALTFGFVQVHAAALTIEKQAKADRLEAVSEAADLIEHEIKIIANTLENRSWT